MKTIAKYLCARLNERSFWVGVGLAVSAAAVLPYPWNYISFAAGVMGAIVKDGKVNKGSE